MNIPLELLQLRSDLFTRGDNKEVAKIASMGRKKFTAYDIEVAIRRGRAMDSKIVTALHIFYTKKKKDLEVVSSRDKL